MSKQSEAIRQLLASDDPATAAKRRRAILTMAVDNDPELEAARDQFLVKFHKKRGQGIGVAAASEMIHALGRYLANPRRQRQYIPPPPRPQIDPDGSYTTADVAAYYCIGIDSIRKLIRSGELKATARANGRGYQISGAAIIDHEKKRIHAGLAPGKRNDRKWK